MTIGEYIKQTDIEQYKRLMQMFRRKTKYIMAVDMDSIEESKKYPPREIELGCSAEELMRSDSYKREGRRIKQRSWG